MRSWKLPFFVLAVLLASGGLYLAYSAYDSARQKQEQIRKNLAVEKQQAQNTITAKTKKALESGLRQAYNLELSYDEPSKTMAITDSEANPAEGLDTPLFSTTYTNLLNRGYFLFVYGGQIVFKTPEIETMTLIQEMPISVNGIENIAEGLKITVTKTKFTSVNWTEFIEKPTHQQIAAIAEAYSVHPQLRRIAPSASVLMPN